MAYVADTDVTGQGMEAQTMKIGFIGAGKVGIALARSLQSRGFQVLSIADVKGEEALATARQYLGDSVRYATDNLEVVRSCDIIAITTQDSAIRLVAEKVSKSAQDFEGKFFFHTSGAHSSVLLKTLEEKGALVGSLHPLQTFPDIDTALDVLPDTFIFIEGTEEVRPVLERLAKAIGRTAVPIKATDKVYYHLCAVFVCNLLCALLYSGEKIMERIDITLEPFFPIIKATLRNIESKGTLSSLTGPIVRGDTGTIVDHLAAMRDMSLHREIYKALSCAALGMVKERGIHSDDTLSAMRRLLEANDE